MIMKTGKLDPTLIGLDKEIVMKMRNYEYSMEECLEFLTNNVVEMNEAFASSTIPEKPNYDKVNAFVSRIIHEYLYKIHEGDLISFLNPYSLKHSNFDINNYPLQG